MEFGRTYCCYAYEQSYRPMHDVSKVSLVVICMTETCGSKSFSSIMSRDISRSPRRQTSWGPSWEEVVEPSWGHLSWIDEHNWAVVPRECIIGMPSNVLTTKSHGTRWSTGLTEYDSEEEEHVPCCGHWQCPCCAHLFSEQEHVRLNHEDAAHEAMVDEEHFWDEVHQAIVDMSTDAHDKDIMEQCEYDEQAASS